MAWFDRHSGGKKRPEGDVPKIAEMPKPPPEPVAPIAAVPEEKPAVKQSVPPRAPTPALVGYLHKGSRVNGHLSFQGPARIDGIIDGEIFCQAALTIGASAEVRARISGQIVIIEGKVEGNVTAKERVELLAPARLIGNITTPKLVVTEGVLFDGDCFMGVAKQKGLAATAQTVGVDRVAAAPSAKLQADSKT